jgi:hypothetical protein
MSDIDPGELYRVRGQGRALTNGAALNEKMHLVNNAIDEIGWTSYQTKVAQLSLRFVPVCSQPPAALLPERLRLRGRLTYSAPPEHYVRSGRARVSPELRVRADHRGLRRHARRRTLLGARRGHHRAQDCVQVSSHAIGVAFGPDPAQLLALHLLGVRDRRGRVTELDRARPFRVAVRVRRRGKSYHGHGGLPRVLPEPLQLGPHLHGGVVGRRAAHCGAVRVAFPLCVVLFFGSHVC